LLSSLKIAARVNLLIALAAFGMLVCSGIGLWALRTHMLEDKRAQLSLVMDLVLNDARDDMNENGGARTESGRAAFLQNLKKAKFGDSPAHYFFVYDYDGVAVLHPDRSRLGQNLSNVAYPGGVKMVPKFIEAGKSRPFGGFLEYDGWDGQKNSTAKIAHVRDAPELKAVIGVGAPVKDMRATFLDRLQLMTSLFASALLATMLGGVILSRSICEPLSDAIGKISRLANGNLDIAPANAADKSELGQVDKALDVLRAHAVEQRALQEKVHEQDALLMKQQKESEEHWRQFVEQAPAAMLMLDRNMVHLACSRRWVELHRVDAGIGCRHYDLFPQVPEHWREAHRRGLAGEIVSADEELFESLDGAKQWLRWEVRPWLAADGTVGGITIMTEDVTDRVLAVAALRESELRMRLAQEAARVGIWESRPADKINVWSDNLWKLFGLEQGQCEPKLWVWLSIMHPDDRELVREKVKNAVAAGQEFEVEYRLNRPDGEPERWLFTRGRPFADSAPDNYFGVAIDITEQKLMEEALRESEMRMRLAQEAAKAGALEWRLADNSLHFDDSMWTLCGVPKPEGFEYSIEGWAAIIHPAERERVVAAVMKAAALGHDYTVPWRLNLPEGEPERWFITRCSPIIGANGSPERYFGVNFDVTEQKLAENALRGSEMRMRLAQEAAKTGAWEWRLADNHIQWSDSLWSLYGVPQPEDWKPSIYAWMSLIHPADQERVATEVWEAVTQGRFVEVQWRLKLPEGETERWFLSRGGPLTGANGTPDRYFGVIIEITEQKLMEKAVLAGKDRQAFLLALNDALRSVDDPVEAIGIAAKMLGKKLKANQVVYGKVEETGVSITHDWNDGVASGAFVMHRLDEIDASFIEYLSSGGTAYVDDVRSDPRLCKPEAQALFERGSVAALITVPFVKNNRLLGVLAVHMRNPHPWSKDEISLAQEVAERTWDAVERARISQSLRESEDRLTFALDAAEVGSWEMSLDTGTYTGSDQALSFFDLPAAAQPSYEEIIALLHPDDRTPVGKALRRTAETGQPLKIETRRLLRDGSIRWLDARAERRSVSGRQVIGGLIQDITERVNQKEAVERAAQSKSEFLSNMSHELRTPMHAILGYSEICTDAVREGETGDLEICLENITKAGGRLLSLLDDLLDLSKMEAGKMEYKFVQADLKEVFDYALMELDPLIRAKQLDVNVRLEAHTDAFFDKSHLTQVVINLLSNGIKFSGAGSKLGIHISEEVLGSGEPGVRCRILDEGPGIPDDELEAVFDKFVQSKKTKTGKGGTGLGLAICSHIIKAHGGAIWAENAKPHGAVFTFVIPKDQHGRGSNGIRSEMFS
jgi:PAS domain S-box-containing protein